MPRPQKCRKIAVTPGVTAFKPVGVPYQNLDEVLLSLDELEALRLSHMEGLYQVGVSERMGVSRQTAGRILESAHEKITRALVKGKAIRIEGGVYEHSATEEELCDICGEPRHLMNYPGRRKKENQCRCRRRSKLHMES